MVGGIFITGGPDIFVSVCLSNDNGDDEWTTDDDDYDDHDDDSI